MGESSIGLGPDRHLVGVLIHGQLAGTDDRVLFRVHRAAQDRLDPGDDLVEGEGLGDVVVAADGEAGDLVLRVVLRGEEQDGGGVARGTQPLGHAEPVHVGEHDVEDDQVGLLLEDGRDRRGAVADCADGESGEAEARREQIADIGFVVDDENAGTISHALILCVPAECNLGVSRVRE